LIKAQIMCYVHIVEGKTKMKHFCISWRSQWCSVIKTYLETYFLTIFTENNFVNAMKKY